MTRYLVKVMAPVLTTVAKSSESKEESGDVYMLSNEFEYSVRFLEVCRFQAESMTPAKREGFTVFDRTTRDGNESRMVVKNGHFRTKEIK